MEILSRGEDLFDKINYCQMCECVFKTNREDGIVELENGISKLYVQCPSCYSYILIGASRQIFIKKGDRK